MNARECFDIFGVWYFSA